MKFLITVLTLSTLALVGCDRKLGTDANMQMEESADFNRADSMDMDFEEDVNKRIDNNLDQQREEIDQQRDRLHQQSEELDQQREEAMEVDEMREDDSFRDIVPMEGDPGIDNTGL